VGDLEELDELDVADDRDLELGELVRQAGSVYELAARALAIRRAVLEIEPIRELVRDAGLSPCS
jgi:hypothetical protein